MYDRRVEDRELLFGHTGRLYEGSFVLYDRQTGSQWVQVTGQAKTGPYKGNVLKFIPSTVTSWQKWKTLFPDTKVLPGSGRDGFMGTYRGFLQSQNIGLVVTHFNQARLYPFETLEEESVINDIFRGEPIVVAFYKAYRTATAWRREVNGDVLTFRLEYDSQKGFLIVDNETDSRWDPITGRALDGLHEGLELPALTHNPILIDRFKAHYPEGEVYPG